jgi:sigma-E factor negative regulatory protein RseB
MRWLPKTAVVVLLLGGLTLGSGGSALGQTDAATNDAASLLQSAQQAAKTKNYQGTFAHQRNGQMRAFKVTHRFEGSDEFERLEVLTDQPREYLRHNDQVQCLVPDRELIMIEQQHQERFPALLMGSVERLTEYYELTVDPLLRRVAGLPCHSITIRPKDQHRSHYELCVDQQSGLLLEARMHDEDGSVLEHIAFTQVQIGEPISMQALEPAWSTQGWRVVQHEHTTIDLKALGWFFREPPGYSTVAEVARQFRDGRQVSQLILTDGLANISVFIEPYQENLSHHQMAGASRSGAVNLYGKRYGSYWVMVAGEAPANTVRALAQSFVRSGALHNR